jgi:hypothetical protein
MSNRQKYLKCLNRLLSTLGSFMRLSAIDYHARQPQNSASELPDLRYEPQARAQEVMCALVNVDVRLRLALGKHSIWEPATSSGARDDASGFALPGLHLLWYKR